MTSRLGDGMSLTLFYSVRKISGLTPTATVSCYRSRVVQHTKPKTPTICCAGVNRRFHKTTKNHVSRIFSERELVDFFTCTCALAPFLSNITSYMETYTFYTYRNKLINLACRLPGKSATTCPARCAPTCPRRWRSNSAPRYQERTAIR